MQSKNLEGWEHKITDKMEHLEKHLDACCTEPLVKETDPKATDLKVDYRAWTNFFTIDAILDIDLSQPAGFLDRGNEDIISE